MRIAMLVLLTVLLLLPAIGPAPLAATRAVAEVEILVLGGGPEGVAAAVAAARRGRRVLLVEPRHELGGPLVQAWLNTIDMNRDPDGRILNGGLFAEWYARVEGESFHPDTAAAAFRALLAAEPNIRLWPDTRLTGVSRDGRQIAGVRLTRDGRPVDVIALRYVDATPDADLAAAAGVQFIPGRADYGGGTTGQAATLVFRLDGLDWRQAAAAMAADGDEETGATPRSLWGCKALYGYQPARPEIGLRALNAGRVGEESALINALWIFGIDPLDNTARERARAVATAELPRVVAFIRARCPGFAEARLAGTAPGLYIRESRHMAEAIHQLTIDDVLENRDQPDAVAYGSYPVDIQGAAPGDRPLIVGVPRRYAVPLRALVPRSRDNLLVASRSAGYTALAHGSARTIPVGMAVGQAAGVAAAVSLERGAALPALAGDPAGPRAVQNALRTQGVSLAPFREPSPLEGRPGAEDVRHFRRLGLVAAGYRNEYGLERPVAGPELAAFLSLASVRFQRPLAPFALPPAQPTIQEAASLMLQASGQAAANEPLAAAVAAGAVPRGVRPDQRITRALLYRMARVLLFPR